MTPEGNVAVACLFLNKLTPLIKQANAAYMGSTYLI